MTEYGVKTTEEWSEMQRLVGRTGNAAIRSLIGIGPADIDLDRDFLGLIHDKYEQLALFYRDIFINQLPLGADRMSTSMSVRHGFLTTGRLLGYCVRAYQKHLEESGESSAITSLQEALLDERTVNDLVIGLAKMPNDKNRIYEEYYGLVDGGYAINGRYIETPIEYVSINLGSGFFKPKAELMIQAYRESPDVQTNDDLSNTCPAHKSFVPGLWRNMVGQCAEYPQFFAEDLGLTTTVSD